MQFNRNDRTNQNHDLKTEKKKKKKKNPESFA